MKPMLFCAADDRPGGELALRLLLLSFARHCPGDRLHLRFPPASAAFKAWAARFPFVSLVTDPVAGAKGWNMKPALLAGLIEAGEPRVTWIDADVIVTGPPPAVLRETADDVVVGTRESPAERRQGGACRAHGWGLRPAREFGATINTAVLRVARPHLPVLRRWRELVSSPAYLDWQALPFPRRPFWAAGDQDALTGLLASDEFATVPVYLLRAGREIVHHLGPSGFTVGARLAMLLRGEKPAFVHAQGDKPWLIGATPPASSGKLYVKALIQELSAYTMAAQAYRDELGPPAGWLCRRSLAGRLLRLFDFGLLPLRGLPLAIGKQLWSAVRDRRPRVMTTFRLDDNSNQRMEGVGSQ